MASYNLLSFFLADQNPPFPHSEFWPNWQWFVKPLLSTYARRGGQLKEVPALWPGDTFASHRLQTRRIFDALSSAQQPRTSDPGEYINRVNAAHERAIRDSMVKSFGENALDNANGTSARPWVKKIASLVDPLSFPLESVVYAKQQSIADALEIIEQNTNLLERYRRERVMENARLYEEINRLRGALYVLERLETNLNRVLSNNVQ
jgi:hypothetical protein